MGVKTLALGEKDLTPGTDLNIIGDNVLEIKFDEKVFKKIEQIFKKFKRIEEIPTKIVSELATMKGRHEFKIIRNAMLAKRLKEGLKV